MPRDFDDNYFPLAYLITFRCYGTWLHGDERGSIARKQNSYGSERIEPNLRLERSEQAMLKSKPLQLDARQRPIVEKAIREVCSSRQYHLQAVNVRTNHAHAVVSAACKPEPILNSFKAYATRGLRDAGLLDRSVKPWSRHGSTRYLWKEPDVAWAIEYVLNGQ